MSDNVGDVGVRGVFRWTFSVFSGYRRTTTDARHGYPRTNTDTRQPRTAVLVAVVSCEHHRGCPSLFADIHMAPHGDYHGYSSRHHGVTMGTHGHNFNNLQARHHSTSSLPVHCSCSSARSLLSEGDTDDWSGGAKTNGLVTYSVNADNVHRIKFE